MMATDTESKLNFIETLKQRWMAMVDAIQDPLMIVDHEYNIEKANKALAELSSSSIKAVLGTKCYKSFANRSSPCPGCQMKKALKEQTTQQFELNNARADRYHEVTAQPIIGANNNIEGMVTIYRDRTEAKAMQDQLQQSEKLASIGLLAGGIAHEINNPLGGIIIFSQMLLREMDKESSHYVDVVEIEAAAQRCKEIVESLLDFARSQPSRQATLEKVDMKHAILSALKFGLVGSSRMDIDVKEFWELPNHHCQGNRNKIIQLFLNLIQNAIQAMPKGGTLILKSSEVKRQDRAWAAFSVSDSGIGIQKKFLDKIFDPFFTSKPEGEGTGLGLSICHGIVTEYGGLIEIDSKVGQGTTFRILLPKIHEQQIKDIA